MTITCNWSACSSPASNKVTARMWGGDETDFYLCDLHAAGPFYQVSAIERYDTTPAD